MSDRPTPLFAAAAALPSLSATTPAPPSWTSIGTTFVHVPHSHYFPNEEPDDEAAQSAGTPEHQADDDVSSDEDASSGRRAASRLDEPLHANKILPPQPHASATVDQPSFFVIDRGGDGEQARFQRMYAGDRPSYHAPSAAWRHNPVGLSALTFSAHGGGRRLRRLRILDIPEGVGSGVVRQALTTKEAAAAKSDGGVWAQVAAEKAAAQKLVAKARESGAGGRYFHSAAAAALGDANSRAAAALDAAGVHLSEGGARLASLRRDALCQALPSDYADAGELPAPEDANQRLARLISEGYSKQGLTSIVSVAGVAASVSVQAAGATGHSLPHMSAYGSRGFLPLMPAAAAAAAAGAAIITRDTRSVSQGADAASQALSDEVVSAARAPWEAEAGYAARRLRQLHALARLFPADQRVWRTLLHATLSLHAPSGEEGVGETRGGRTAAAASARRDTARRVTLEAALAIAESALRASPSAGTQQQLQLDHLCLVCALGDATDAEAVDRAWQSLLLPRPGAPPPHPRPRLWVEHLLWLRGCFAVFSMAAFRSRVHAGLESVASARAHALEVLRGGAVTLIEGPSSGSTSTLAVRLRMCDAATIDILTVAAATEAGAGYAERGVALWQAAFEFNVGRPAALAGLPRETVLRFFAGFWDSEHARIGDALPSVRTSAAVEECACDDDGGDAAAPNTAQAASKGDAATQYFCDIASSGWRSWQASLVSGLSVSERSAAGLVAVGARKRRFNPVAATYVDEPATDEAERDSYARVATFPAFKALSEAFSAGERLSVMSAAASRGALASKGNTLASSGIMLDSNVSGDLQAPSDTGAFADVSACAEPNWGSLGVSEFSFEALSRAREAQADAKAASDALAGTPAIPAALCEAAGVDSDGEPVPGPASAVDLAAALVRVAASRTAAGTRASSLAVPPGFISYYSPLHGYRIVVPARAVDAAAGGYDAGLDLLEAAGEGDAYRRALLNAATDRTSRTAALAAAAAADRGSLGGSAAALVLPSAETAQAGPRHGLTRWLRRCAQVPGSGPGDLSPRAPLRLCEVDPAAYSQLPIMAAGTAAAGQINPVAATDAPGSGWVTVEQSANGTAAGDGTQVDPGTACALAAASRLVLSPHAHVPLAHVRCALVDVGAQLHCALAARFLASLGVRLRHEVGSSRSSAHALARATDASSLRPGARWAEVLQSTPAVSVGSAGHHFYAGQVVDIDPEAVATPAAAGFVRRTIHRMLLPAPGATPAAAAPVVALFRAALIDFEAGVALHAARAGVPKAYDAGRRVARAVLSMGGGLSGAAGSPDVSTWAVLARCPAGVDEWLAYARLEAAFGRRDRATAALSAIMSRAARAPPGPAACSPSTALVTLEFCAAALATPDTPAPSRGAPEAVSCGPAAGPALVSLGMSLVPASDLSQLAGLPPAALATPVEAARAALRVSVGTAARAYIADVEAVCARWVAAAAAARRVHGAAGEGDAAGELDALFAAALVSETHGAGGASAAAPRRSRWGAFADAPVVVQPVALGSVAPSRGPALHSGFTAFGAAISRKLGLGPPPPVTAAEAAAAGNDALPPPSTVLGIAPLLACSAFFAYAHADAHGSGGVAAADSQFRRAYMLLLGLVRTLVVARLRVEGAYTAADSSAEGGATLPRPSGNEEEEEAAAQAEEDVNAFVPALERWLAAAATPAASRLSARLAHLAPVVFASGRVVLSSSTAASRGVPSDAAAGGSDGLSSAELRSAVLQPSGGLGLSAGFPDPLGTLDAGLADSSTALGAAVDSLLSAAEWLLGWHTWLLRLHATVHAAPPRLLRQALQLAATAFPGNLGFVHSYLQGGGGGCGSGGLGAGIADGATRVGGGGGSGWGALSTQAHVQGILGQWGPDAPPEPRIARLLLVLGTLARMLNGRLAALLPAVAAHPPLPSAVADTGSDDSDAAVSQGDIAAAAAAVKRLGRGLLAGGGGGGGDAADWAYQALCAPSAAPQGLPTVWRAVLRSLLLVGEPPGLVVRAAFLRGVHACPWARPLWVDALARLRAYVSHLGAAGLLRTAALRGVEVPPPPLPEDGGEEGVGTGSFV